MAVIVQCPACKKRQSLRNKICACGENLDKAKRAGRVNYWLYYRLPGGKQVAELIGRSFEDAKTINAERTVQKARGGLPYKSRVTFDELKRWYVELEKVKALASYRQMVVGLERFCRVYGSIQVNKLKQVDLEDLQMKRRKEGLADATIDDEICHVRTMVNKAFDNDMVGGEPLKAFKRTQRLLKHNANARDRVLAKGEYTKLYNEAAEHLKPIIATGYHTGMRLGEILGLTWDKVDLAEGFIHLEAEDTKDEEPRSVPINEDLKAILERLPRALHISHVFLYIRKLKKRDETIIRPVKDIKRALMDACEKAGILYGKKVRGGFIFHDLRHTFNTNMRKAGVDETVIMAITGHSTRQMFDRYNTVDMEDTRDGIEKMRCFLTSVDLSVDQPQNAEKVTA